MLLFSVIPLRLPTYAVIGGWAALNVYNAFAADAETSGVAWWAHVGGFAAGAALIRFFKLEHVPLWDMSGDARWQIGGLTLPSQRRDGDK